MTAALVTVLLLCRDTDHEQDNTYKENIDLGVLLQCERLSLLTLYQEYNCTHGAGRRSSWELYSDLQTETLILGYKEQTRPSMSF